MWRVALLLVLRVGGLGLVAWGAFGGIASAVAAEAVPLTEAIAERVRELRREVAYHDDLYFRKAAPEISDYDYDRLKAELRRLEAAYPEIGDGGAPAPAAVGDDRDDSWPKARHRVPMGSLAKVFAADELAAFHAGVERALGTGDVAYLVEPKFDGVAISVTYEAGRLVRAVTRGNGEEGDDVTPNICLIPGVPQRLAGAPETWPAVVELRGEVYLTKAAFERVNAAETAGGGEAFANPRNLAAGTLKQHEAAVVAERGLSVVFFGWGAWEPPGNTPATLNGFRVQVAAWGLPVAPHVRAGRGFAAMHAAVGWWEAEREKLPYPTDGVVVKVADVAAQRILGEGASSPRWAVAYKFAPARATTRLTGIDWQVGRTGAVTPVAEFVSVALAGSEVARASLHNAGRVEALGLHEGDAIVVEKAGEIIPVVVGIDLLRRQPHAVRCAVPAECPSCGARLTREGAGLRCEDAGCPAQLAGRLAHFASRAGMDIDGLGPALARRLVESGRVRSPADVYGLTFADWTALPGVGTRTGEQLMAAVAASRARGLEQVIVALGVPGVGPAGARALAGRYGSLAALAEASAADQAGEDATLRRAQAAWLADPAGRAGVHALLAAGLRSRVAVEGEEAGGPMAGAVVVFTGALEGWTRAEAEAAVVAAGGEVGGDVTARTTVVVAGARAGATREKAEARGVPVIDEAEFRRRLGR